MDMTDTHLPAVAANHDAALVGEASRANVVGALERLVMSLHQGAYDDATLRLDIVEGSDGSKRTLLNYHCFRHQRR